MKALPEALTAYWARKGTKPFSERDFALLTREFGFPIPPEVGDFLIEYGAVPFCTVDTPCEFDVAEHVGSISHIRAAERMLEYYRGLTREDGSREFPKIPDGYLPIGSDFGQSEILIDCLGIPGRVCFWEFQYDRWGDGGNDTITTVAMSLLDFLINLRFIED